MDVFLHRSQEVETNSLPAGSTPDIPVAEARGLTARFDKSACHYNSIIQDIACRCLHSSLASWTVIQFNPPQDQVSNTSEDEAKLEANVHTKGWIDQFSDRPDIVELRSTKQDSHQASYHRCDGGPTNGKSAGSIPIINVVPPTTEHKVLYDQDDCPGTEPVGNDEQVVGECMCKVGRSRKGDQHVNHCTDECPDVPLDALEGTAKHLHG